MLIFGLHKVYHDEGIWIAALMMLFPIAGLYIIYLFLKSLFQWRRFGRTYLTLTPFPGSIGGQVGGTIAVNAKLSSQDSYKVSLSCVNKYSSGGESSERKIWQKDSFAQVLSKGASSELVFQFNVPDHLPATESDQSDSYHQWRLNLITKDKRLKRKFEIPVFATATTSSLKVSIPKHHAVDEDAALLKTYLPLQTPSAQSFISSQTEEIKIHYPLFNRPLIKLISLIVGVIFAGIGFTMHGDIPAFFSGIFIISGGVTALSSLYFLLSSLTIVLDKQSITSTKRFLGMFPHHKKALFSAIKEIKSKVVMSSSAEKETNHYEIMASLKGGNDILLAHQIEGEQAKELIVDYFYKTMGIRAEDSITSSALSKP